MVSPEEQEMRFRCIQLVMSTAYESPTADVERAQAYYDFVTGKAVEDARALSDMKRILDMAQAQVAAEAIRSSFFVSVSGEDAPYRYHLRLAFPTMEEMHKAEDALKAFAKCVSFQPLADRIKARDAALSEQRGG